MKIPSKEIIRELRWEYPKGTRVQLVKMDDPNSPPVGTMGTVSGVDGIGSLLVAWDTGSHLNVIFNEDIVKTIAKVQEDL